MDLAKVTKAFSEIIACVNSDGGGYEQKAIKSALGTSLVPGGIRGIYRNSRHRELVIKAIEVQGDVIISFSVFNIENKNSFDIADYLKYVSYNFSYSDFRVEIIDNYYNVYKLISMITVASLRPILNGEAWIDIPFNWGGMR